MKKGFFHILIIFAVILLMLFLGVKNGKELIAYDPVFEACQLAFPSEIAHFGPNLVNGMSANLSCASQGPPFDSDTDGAYWLGYAPFPTPAPTPFLPTTEPPWGALPNSVYALFNGMLKITWTGDNNDKCQDYIYLNSDRFENVGCSGATLTAGTAVTHVAGDWGCYEYIRFFFMLNEAVNSGSPVPISQTASFFDGAVTVTAGPVQISSQYGGSIDDHFTASLNYLANIYDTANSRYFSVSNMAKIMINAVGTAYTSWNNNEVIMYYDYVTLGARDQVPTYYSPQGLNVTTARGPNPVEGAYISWNPVPVATPVPTFPITGYHVYKSLNPGPGNGPYVSIGVFPASVSGVVDTSCPGNGTYCYKVLTTNLGPSANPADEQLNSINATYHEALLTDVSESCGYIEEVPTPTITPGGTAFAGTPTATPTATWNTNLDQAQVYPNPFNPNKGSRNFYVGNVAIDTKVSIFAMDGALVMNGALSVGDLHYEAASRRFKWDGKNKNGSQVVSGLYYLVLEDPSKKTIIKRIIICYKCDPVYNP